MPKATATTRPGIPLFVRNPADRVEPPGRFRLGHHQRRAGFGVWAATVADSDRDAIKAWKRRRPLEPGAAAPFVERLAELVELWCPVLPSGLVVTSPPQGVSAPEGPACDAAAILARLVAERLVVPYRPMLRRSPGESKKYHGHHYALAQAPFTATIPEGPARPAIALIVDDLSTSGVTMKLSLEVIRGPGIAAFGFAFSGI